MPALADWLSGLREVNVVLLTASATELRRRYERAPDAWFTIDQIVAANERIPSIETLLPTGVRRIHIDTTARSLDDVYADVRTFLHF